MGQSAASIKCSKRRKRCTRAAWLPWITMMKTSMQTSALCASFLNGWSAARSFHSCCGGLLWRAAAVARGTWRRRCRVAEGEQLPLPQVAGLARSSNGWGGSLTCLAALLAALATASVAKQKLGEPLPSLPASKLVGSAASCSSSEHAGSATANLSMAIIAVHPLWCGWLLGVLVKASDTWPGQAIKAPWPSSSPSWPHSGLPGWALRRTSLRSCCSAAPLGSPVGRLSDLGHWAEQPRACLGCLGHGRGELLPQQVLAMPAAAQACCFNGALW